MADCNEKYFPNGPVDVCADQWLSWWMCKSPYKGKWSEPWKTLIWLVAGVILKQMAKQTGWCCVPSCLGKECGDDGCGGTCGDCPLGTSCMQGECKEFLPPGVMCIPNCFSPDGPPKQCGHDGCGGTCGDCPPGYLCDEPQAVCQPDCPHLCAGKECGKAGLDGECNCGKCPVGQKCKNGECVPATYYCLPNCGFKQCGPDGCGGSCGDCPQAYTCDQFGMCQPDCKTLCLGKECGAAGLYGECNCGGCAEGLACEDGTCVLACKALCENVGCGTVPGPLPNTSCFCGQCEPSQLCWNNVCSLPVCSPECTASGCWSAGCKKECDECQPPSVCSSSGTCCGPISDEKAQAYLALLADQTVADILGLSKNEKSALMTFVHELECNAVQEWAEFDDIGVSLLTLQDVRKIWLRRVAVWLYQEVNQIYPWSLMPVNDGDVGDPTQFSPDLLAKLLAFSIGQDGMDPAPWEDPLPEDYMDIKYAPFSGGYFFAGVNSPNPAIEMLIAHEIKKLYEPETPLDALYAFIEHLRAIHWQHEPGDYSAEALGFTNVTLATYWALRRTGCHSMVDVARNVLRAFGIPVCRTTLAGHSGFRVSLPTGDLVMLHGDDVYRTGLNYIPAHESFFTPAECLEWATTLPAAWPVYWLGSACSVFFHHDKQCYLRWFKYYDDPAFGQELKSEFCQIVNWCLKGKTCDSSELYTALFKSYSAGIMGCPKGPDSVSLIDDDEIMLWYDKLEKYYETAGQCPEVPC